jgi:hypothetical protein
MKLFFITLIAALLSACATDPAYYKAVEAQVKAAGDVKLEKAKALTQIATNGDVTSRTVAAIMLGGFGGGQEQAVQIAAPKTFWDGFLDFSRIWAAPLVQVYATGKQADVSIRQSDNSVLVQQSSDAVLNTAFSKIQAPGAVTTTTTTNTLAGTGVLGNGTYTTDSHNTDNHSVDSHSVDSHAVYPAPVDATPIVTPVVPCVPQPHGATCL